MRVCKLLLLVATIAIVLGSLSPAHATVIMTGDSGTVAGTFTASATDLVNAGRATLGSGLRSHDDYWHETAGVIPNSNDGTIGPGGSGADGELYPVDSFGNLPMYNLPVAFTYMLNTSTNALGFDITQIDSYAGWPSENRSLANQTVKVEISKVGDSSWLDLGTFSYAPFTTSEIGTSEARVRLTNDGGGVLSVGTYAATGVDGVRITQLDNGSTDATFDGIILREIDVFGQGTVPEPGASVLLASGIIGLLAYAWKKRK